MKAESYMPSPVSKHKVTPQVKTQKKKAQNLSHVKPSFKSTLEKIPSHQTSFAQLPSKLSTQRKVKAPKHKPCATYTSFIKKEKVAKNPKAYLTNSITKKPIRTPKENTPDASHYRVKPWRTSNKKQVVSSTKK